MNIQTKKNCSILIGPHVFNSSNVVLHEIFPYSLRRMFVKNTINFIIGLHKIRACLEGNSCSACFFHFPNIMTHQPLMNFLPEDMAKIRSLLGLPQLPMEEYIRLSDLHAATYKELYTDWHPPLSDYEVDSEASSGDLFRRNKAVPPPPHQNTILNYFKPI